MSNALLFRLAGADDIERLSITGAKAFRATYGHTAPASHVDTHVERNFGVPAIAAAMQEPGVEYHIALAGASCAGFLKLRDSMAPQASGGASAIEVQQLYVSQDHQRLGIGRALLDRAVRTARERGVDGIWLSVWSKADWATGFYRRFGFAECGTEPFCMGGTEHMDYIMWFPND